MHKIALIAAIAAVILTVGNSAPTGSVGESPVVSLPYFSDDSAERPVKVEQTTARELLGSFTDSISDLANDRIDRKELANQIRNSLGNYAQERLNRFRNGPSKELAEAEQTTARELLGSFTDSISDLANGRIDRNELVDDIRNSLGNYAQERLNRFRNGPSKELAEAEQTTARELLGSFTDSISDLANGRIDRNELVDDIRNSLGNYAQERLNRFRNGPREELAEAEQTTARKLLGSLTDSFSDLANDRIDRNELANQIRNSLGNYAQERLNRFRNGPSKELAEAEQTTARELLGSLTDSFSDLANDRINRKQLANQIRNSLGNYAQERLNRFRNGPGEALAEQNLNNLPPFPPRRLYRILLHPDDGGDGMNEANARNMGLLRRIGPILLERFVNSRRTSRGPQGPRG